MITPTLVNKIIIRSIESATTSNRILYNSSSYFTGPQSKLESIEVVQIIASIEEELQKLGIVGYDLFDKVFNYEKLLFVELEQIILEDLT